MNQHTFLATAAFGLEGVAANELKRMDIPAKAENGDFRSFSFRITAEDKVVVYSGDVRSPDEFADWSSKCDAVLMESGHHHPWEVCAKWKENGCEINKVIFMHHGRDYVNQPTQTAVAARRVWGKDVIFAEDDMIIEL